MFGPAELVTIPVYVSKNCEAGETPGKSRTAIKTALAFMVVPAEVKVDCDA
jgi:hypothetical protein